MRCRWAPSPAPRRRVSSAPTSFSGSSCFLGWVVGISQLGRRCHHHLATALCLVLLLGLGALFLSVTREYSQEVFSLLFGEVLGVGADEIAPIAILSALSVAAIAVMFRPLLLNSV
jgi:zinc/manganese transport system permease protein